MGVRLIAGRAGSGKTHGCQARICEALASSLADGPRLIMLVPEQAALQMERALLAMAAVPALGRCEVLSFRRLAHRILNETPGHTPAALTPTGRQMALRHLIARHRRALREFGKVADRAGFVAAIARTIAELLQESVSVEQLETTAKTADDEDDPCAPRLHDAALLYRAYLDYLGSQRVDPEGVLDLARTRLASVSWLAGAHIWIDGFAGLTQQQVRMIVSLASRAAHVDIAMLLDPERGRAVELDTEPDDLSLFARTEQTWFALARALIDAGVPIEPPLVLGLDGAPRFKNAGVLATLERNLFSAPASHGPDPSPDCRRRDSASALEAPVRLVRAPDRRTEVAAAVRCILDFVQRPQDPLRYRDIAIIVRDLTPYHDLISAQLSACDIPFFIDRRRPTYHHPLVELVRAALAMLGDAPFDQTIAMLLKTGLSGLDDDAADALENYVLAHGLLSPAAWDEDWTYPVIPGEDAERLPPAAREALAAIVQSRDQLRRRIGAWWPTAGARQSRPACRTWVQRLYDVLDRLAVPGRLAQWCDSAVARGDLDEVEEHRQVWADLMKLLDELAATLGDERMTGRQFRDILEAGLAEFTLGLVPATLDQVLVSSIERSRHPPVRAVFVLGFADGQFPAVTADATLFGDDERARLEAAGARLGRTQARQLLDERMLAYVAVTRPSEHLWVSYPRRDDEGREVFPSPYWSALKAALPDVPVESAAAAGPETINTAGRLAAEVAAGARAWCERQPDEQDSATWPALYEWARTDETVRTVVAHALTALGPPAEARLLADAAAALWPPPHRTSVSRLEQFAGCPFQHFAARGLRLRPRPRHEITALDIGRLYHTLLEQFVNEMIETGTHLRDMPADQIAASLHRLCASVVPDYAERIRMDEPQRRHAEWCSRQEIPPAVAGQKSAIARGPMTPLATEMHFGDGSDDALPALELKTAGGQTVCVRGIIDRIDVVDAGDHALAVVFDYKRSIDKRLRLDEAYHGLALQLLAYLLVLRDHGRDSHGAALVPGGAFYLPLVGSYQRVDHPAEAESEAFNSYKAYLPRGIIDFDWIDALEPALETGRGSTFSVRRNKDGGMGDVDRTDAVGAGALPALLDHLRRRMTELAERWIGGDIAVAPSRLGDDLPCERCAYRSVCRMEYTTRQGRRLERLSRSEVLRRLAGGSEPDHG